MIFSDKNYEEIKVEFQCGRCKHEWIEPINPDKIVCPRGCVPKHIGVIARCQKCRRKSVFPVPDELVPDILKILDRRNVFFI